MKNSKLLLTSLLAAATMGTSAYAGFVWNGGETITQELWQTQSSWTLTDGTTWPTGGNGPLTPDSNAWNGVTVANASGTVDTFEGWALGLTLQNANLTVTAIKKFQNNNGLGCTINLDKTSTLSMTLNGNGNFGENVTVNTEGVFNLALGKTYDGDGFIANLGSTGIFNISGAHPAKVSSISAKLGNGSSDVLLSIIGGNTVYTRNLVTLSDGATLSNSATYSFTDASDNVLTAVASFGDLDFSKYYAVKDASGYSVSYLVSGISDEVYRWQASGDSSVWSAAVWTKGETTGQNITSDGIAYFGAGDGLASTVTIDAATTVGRLIIDADYTFNGSNYLAMTSGGVVNAGATLILEKSGNGDGGFLRGEIEVAGTLQLNNGDVTGWSNTAGNNLRTITVDVGGVLKLNHGTNETFLGTLNLNGTLSGKNANTRWDMFNENSEIVVAAGANALIDENVKLVIRRNNAPITVGADATLTINGQVLKSSVVGQSLGGNGVLVKNGAGTLTLNGNVDVTGLTVSGGKVAVGAAAGASVSGTVEMGTATLDGGTAGITAGTLKYGYGSEVNTATIQGKVNVTGNVQQTSTGQTDNEKISLAAGAEMTVGGTFGTTAANAYDTNQVSVVLNIGDNASLTSANIANANKLTVTLGANATLSATTALTLNAAWGNKTHSFTGAGADSSKVLATALALKHNVYYGNTDPTTLSLSSLRLEVGAGGITVADDGKSKLALTNTTLGVRDGADGWSSDVAMTFSGSNSADVDADKSITLNGVISDATDSVGSLKKTGAGTLTLNGNNTFTGGVKLEAGTLELGHNNALGNGADLIVTGNSELKLGGELNVANNVVFDNSAGTVSTLTINVAADTELSGGLLSFDQNEIRKVGAGTLTLSGDSQWFSHGTISIETGTILAKSANALGAVAEASDNKVRLSGGQLEVGSGVTLAQTNIEIVLSDAYSSTAAIIGADATARLAENTVVTITELDLAGIALASEAALANSSYEFKILDTISAGENLTFKLSEALRNDWQISDYTDGVLTISAIPEPSVFGLLAGLGALALAGTRRRRKKA